MIIRVISGGLLALACAAHAQHTSGNGFPDSECSSNIAGQSYSDTTNNLSYTCNNIIGLGWVWQLGNAAILPVKSAPSGPCMAGFPNQQVIATGANYACVNGTWATATGTQGPAGPTGPQGPQGSPGSQGPTGLTGPQGPTGQDGATGAQGAAGATGSTGPQGAKGDTGLTGPQGIQGLTGNTGADGAQGIQGPKGDTGAQGTQGPQGATGASGTNGTNGTVLPTGLISFIASGTCPSGWTEVTAMSGFYVLATKAANSDVGTSASASLSLTAAAQTFTGTPFSSVINHTHTVTVTYNVQGGTSASTTGTHVMTSAATGGSARAPVSGDVVSATTANPSGGVSSITPGGTNGTSAVAGTVTPAFYKLIPCSKN